MAQKRMFTMKIVDSDAFLEMPLSTQCLYFHLNMRADDDGFVGNPKKILRMIGASEDDLKLLLVKRFLLIFDDSVVVIKHWWMHNTLSKDRYHETSYTDEKAQLYLKDNKSYTTKSVNKMLTDCKQNVNADLDLDLGLGKDKDLVIDAGRFKKPTVEQIAQYCRERNNKVDASRFFDYYESKGWMIGKNKMKDWKACVRTWEKNEDVYGQKKELKTSYSSEAYQSMADDVSSQKY